MELEMLQLDVE